MSKIEVGTKLLQIRIYGNSADNYETSFFIFKDGEHGVISGLNGIAFYKNIVQVFEKLRDECGVTIIHGSVTEVHARLIKRYSKRFTVTYEPTICEGRNMVWITAILNVDNISAAS